MGSEKRYPVAGAFLKVFIAVMWMTGGGAAGTLNFARTQSVRVSPERGRLPPVGGRGRSSRLISNMRKTIVVTAALLLGTASFAVAQNRGGSTSPGASQYSPGHEMQGSKTSNGPGASEYSPGDQMRGKGTTVKSKGASEYSPGDRMNDKRRQ